MLIKSNHATREWIKGHHQVLPVHSLYDSIKNEHLLGEMCKSVVNNIKLRDNPKRSQGTQPGRLSQTGQIKWGIQYHMLSCWVLVGGSGWGQSLLQLGSAWGTGW